MLGSQDDIDQWGHLLRQNDLRPGCHGDELQQKHQAQWQPTLRLRPAGAPTGPVQPAESEYEVGVMSRRYLRRAPSLVPVLDLI